MIITFYCVLFIIKLLQWSITKAYAQIRRYNEVNSTYFCRIKNVTVKSLPRQVHRQKPFTNKNLIKVHSTVADPL